MGCVFGRWISTSQEHVPLRLYLVHGAGKAERVVLTDPRRLGGAPAGGTAPRLPPRRTRPSPPRSLIYERWLAALRAAFPEELADEVMAQSAAVLHRRAGFRCADPAAHDEPGGPGLPGSPGNRPDAWNPNPKKQIQIRRRFMLLGQTLEGMRVWDIRRAIQAIRSIREVDDLPVCLSGARKPGVRRPLCLVVRRPDRAPGSLGGFRRSHERGPDYSERAPLARYSPGGGDGCGTFLRPSAPGRSRAPGTIRKPSRRRSARKYLLT